MASFDRRGERIVTGSSKGKVGAVTGYGMNREERERGERKRRNRDEGERGRV